ncbi:hypothetical protein K7X08_015256 [Anisodus acutangulus]|uniref:Uncharacterized protein n=1 Tax=Anisodus acutangulus TaxID=402998 RepID=A0A9Q1QUQ3_9SOLA|nr:hypothetical protein K7X08_015256 [Anisodus acutangulus]
MIFADHQHSRIQKTKTEGSKEGFGDAVNMMELMDLRHSTLQEEISSDAFISLDEAIKDLTHLDWQECCASSLQTICFSNGVNVSVHCKEKTNASASSVLNRPPPMKNKKAPSQQSAGLTNEQVDLIEESVNDEQVAFSGVIGVQSAVSVSFRDSFFLRKESWRTMFKKSQRSSTMKSLFGGKGDKNRKKGRPSYKLLMWCNFLLEDGLD